jgi:hypothetical protein
MADQVPSFTYANELGFIRKEYVASTIDALRVETHAGQPNGKFSIIQLSNTVGCKVVSKVMKAPNSVTGPKQRLITQSLLDIETGNPVEIPAGSTIEVVKVCKSSGATLDDNLSFLLGYLCSEVSGKDAKKSLASRICPADNQVTGRVLNRHHVISFPQKLLSDDLKAQETLYDNDAQAAGEESQGEVGYGCVSKNVYVGESKSLFPSITVTDGTLDNADLVFCLSYCPPAFAQ